MNFGCAVCGSPATKEKEDEKPGMFFREGMLVQQRQRRGMCPWWGGGVRGREAVHQAPLLLTLCHP